MIFVYIIAILCLTLVALVAIAAWSAAKQKPKGGDRV